MPVFVLLAVLTIMDPSPLVLLSDFVLLGVLGFYLYTLDGSC